nr:MAG: ORF1 [TTV-like mini virus]
MPYYNGYRRRFFKPRYRRNYWQKYQRRRWFRPRTRRARKTFRKRRYRRVRKRFNIRKKKAALLLKQWQPELIKSCKIKGIYTLFESNYDTMSNNYTQYRDSWVPEHWPAGGGWGINVFNLGCLFQEFLRVRNWWTVSNVQLPLCRYIKCRLTFYRDEKVDYIVYYTRNYPMTDNEYEHAEACPGRMLMRHKKLIVTSLQRKHRKPYIRKTILPPKLLMNRWFFQRDLVNTNLVMITATPCSLNNYTRAPYSLSNTVYFTTLNPKVFQSLNYHRTNTTEPFHPKPSTYLWGTDAIIDITSPSPLTNVKYNQLIFLGQAEVLRVGNKLSAENVDKYFTNSDNWGNIFAKEYLQKDYHVLVSNVQPGNLAITADKLNNNIDNSKFTVMIEPIYQTVAYNPETDTGKDTEIYLLPNFSNVPNWNPPANDQLKFSGFPLWMLLWGWADWQKKLALVSQIDDHYVIIINSPYFYPSTIKQVMPIDTEFLENYKVHYDTHPDEIEEKPLLSDQLSWHPKFKYQKKTINKLCASGPGTYKFSVNEVVQAHLHYSFYFKWGGSPSTLETIANPERQPKYTTPSNITTGLQIEDPRTDPRHLTYNFDYRRYTLTQKATERLKTGTDIDEPFSISTAQLFNPQPATKTEKDIIETIIQAQTSEKEAQERIQLLRMLRDKQQRLNLKLQQLVLQSIK